MQLLKRLAKVRKKSVNGIRKGTAGKIDYQTKIQFIEKRIDKSLKFFGSHQCMKDHVVKKIELAGGKKTDPCGHLSRKPTLINEEIKESEEEVSDGGEGDSRKIIRKKSKMSA